MDPTSSNRLSRVLEAAAQGLQQIGQTRVQTALAAFQMRTEALKAQADSDYKAQDLKLRTQTEQDTAKYHQSDIDARSKESAAKLAESQAKDQETESHFQQTMALGNARLGVERSRIGSEHADAAATRQQNADTSRANALTEHLRTVNDQIEGITKGRATAQKALLAAQQGGSTQDMQLAQKALADYDAAHAGDLNTLKADAAATTAAYHKLTGYDALGATNPAPATPKAGAANGTMKALPVKKPGMIYTRKGKVMIWDGRSEKPYTPGQKYTDPAGNPLQLYKYDPNATTASPDSSFPQPADGANAPADAASAMDQASSDVASQGTQTDTQMGDQTGLGAQDMGNSAAVGDQAVGTPDLSQGTAGQLAADPQLQQAPLMAQMGAENNQPS